MSLNVSVTVWLAYELFVDCIVRNLLCVNFVNMIQ